MPRPKALPLPKSSFSSTSPLLFESDYLALSEKHRDLRLIPEWRNRCKARWKCRSDLVFLLNNILGKPKVRRDRSPFIEILQTFPSPSSIEEQLEYDSPYLNPFTKQIEFYYRPFTADFTKLIGNRRNLILDPRGWFKSTTNTFGHSVQWIINYPNIAIATIQSSVPKAIENCCEIRDVFRYNQLFRAFFPEHCPLANIDSWGTNQAFTTRARALSNNRKEKTVMALSIDSLVSGYHFDVLKFADIVEEKNASFETGRNFVFNNFGAFFHILQAPASKYHIDVEGTRYHEDETYGRIIKHELSLPLEERTWVIHVRGCYKKKSPSNEPLHYTIDELEYDDYLDETGARISNFPELEDVHELVTLERTPPMTPAKFACQKKCNPIDYDDSEKAFPLKYLNIIKPSNLAVLAESKLLSTVEVAIDTAETQSSSSCENAIIVCQWTTTNKAIIRDLRHGKWTALELMENIYHIHRSFKPSRYYLEETGYNEGLKALFLERSRTQPHRYPILPIQWLLRSRRLDKDSRILANLQPFYLSGNLFALETLPALDALKKQLSGFPKLSRKDIIDPLSDLFTNRSYVLNTPPEEVLSERSQSYKFFHGNDEPTLSGPFAGIGSQFSDY